MKFPAVHTLPARALARLLSGKHTSHRDFQNATATYRLSAAIYSLRNQGWDIRDIWHQEPTSDPTGRIARFKRYFLPEKLIAELGEVGQRYRETVLTWEQKRMRTKGVATPKAHSKAQTNNTGGEL